MRYLFIMISTSNLVFHCPLFRKACLEFYHSLLWTLCLNILFSYHTISGLQCVIILTLHKHSFTHLFLFFFYKDSFGFHKKKTLWNAESYSSPRKWYLFASSSKFHPFINLFSKHELRACSSPSVLKVSHTVCLLALQSKNHVTI